MAGGMAGVRGSTHLRTTDRAAVIAAAAVACKKLRWRCRVSPVRNGWVAVFPAGHGSDMRLTERLVAALDCDVVHVLVDADELTCWFWRAHERVDDPRLWVPPSCNGD